MSGLSEIQQAIEKLSVEERTELRQWLEAFEDAMAKVPNAETLEAIEAGRRGAVFRANSVEEFITALNADDEGD